jgi:hypothetical protein
MIQKTTQSSRNYEQCVNVNLTEVSRDNTYVFHLEVEAVGITTETRGVSAPKLTACGTNTQNN